MDFARINLAADAENGATLHLYNPYTFDPNFPDDVDPLAHNGEPITIDLVGLDGPTGKRAAARMVKALNRKSGKKQSVKDLDEDEILAMGAQNEEVQSRFYAELTTGWRNVTYLADDKMDDPKAQAEPLKFSEDNAAMLYKTRPWIREQVDRFLARKSNFRRV